MPYAKKLADAEIRARLPEVPGWELQGGKLEKTFRFPSFTKAFGFMTSVALVAEAMGHHPDWSNVYNRVTIALVTHDVDGISALDFSLAKQIDELVSTDRM